MEKEAPPTEEKAEPKPEKPEEPSSDKNPSPETKGTEDAPKPSEKTKLSDTKTKSEEKEAATAEEPEASDENPSEASSLENENDTTESGSNLVDETEEEQKAESLAEMELKDVLKINSMNIDFGELFPGQILEETVIILNNLTNTKVPFKIKINCLSKEFDELDEYVYSMRRPTTQDVFNYNDTFLILLAQKAISYYKLAIKVPNIMEEKEILGNIEISCNECQNGVIKIPIKSTIGNLDFFYIWKIYNFISEKSYTKVVSLKYFGIDSNI